MAKFELKLPKMGESVAEATVTGWLKEVGDIIEADESVVEIATDKVDSDVPCEVSGTLVQILHDKDAVVKVGETLAIIEVEGELENSADDIALENIDTTVSKAAQQVEKEIEKAVVSKTAVSKVVTSDRFYSPLVRNIANEEGISQAELDKIPGSGLEGRVTKSDILEYLETRVVEKKTETAPTASKTQTVVPLSLNGEDELIELSRMGKMISDHMIHSVQKSAHVQSFIEVDVTNLVTWRSHNKDAFLKREGEKLTYTPVFMMAVAAAIKEYPLVNLSFDGDKKVAIRKDINLGLAAALGDGNLIVPVIHKADELNLIGMAKVVNDLALRAKNNKLKPDEIQGGTYTVTNVGGFGSLFGTPIINQPEAAILAIGAIRKVPAVLETPEGDVIAIRQKMFLSHSYDHRVINGALGGLFIKFIKDYLEAWDAEGAF
ncbi:dihydrolipoamide acetyltransferase family protein [Flavicella sp.]|uniref:dihydrolipoamide acetyltransferase family protein n=1 Tax=Flavicella sp. TaxID=2957742 RepID=UPI002621A474|nr:dihydrolipoamide acetyltransferase family protein [Flavicella sp.]MDG1803744.1 dihydrolipoamide acetyltransferase family protein [Flavicella sp.]